MTQDVKTVVIGGLRIQEMLDKAAASLPGDVNLNVVRQVDSVAGCTSADLSDADLIVMYLPADKLKAAEDLIHGLRAPGNQTPVLALATPQVMPKLEKSMKEDKNLVACGHMSSNMNIVASILRALNTPVDLGPAI